MRLNELFEEFVIEAPVTNSPAPGSTIRMSLADLYDMTGKTYPTKPGPNGNPIVPPGFFDQKTMKIGGEDGIDPNIAQAHRQWVDGGKLPGLIATEDGELRPYNENNTLVDMSWAFIAGGAELLNNWIKGAAVPIDDFINKFTLTGQLYKLSTGENLSNLKTSTLSGYDERGEEFWGDKIVDYFNDKTDQSFKDNVAATQGAVNTWGDARNLLLGGTGFNIEGVGGIMINELPSEIVDLTLMVTTGPLAGMAASGALNALEAGGAAAQSITDRINAAYDKGILQKQPPFQIAFDAAFMQLTKEQPGMSADERKEEAADMARKHTISMSIQSAYYKVAVTGGVIDAIQNKILYKSNIGAGFMKTAVVKGLAGTTGEGVSGYLEQVFENTGIIDGAGNITTMNEGAFNAAYNEMLASQSGNVLATTTDGVIRVKGATARFRQFLMGGSRDPKAILDIMAMDSNTLINSVTKVDPETGVRKFAIAEMIKKRLITSDQLSKGDRRKLARTGRVTIDGKTYTAKEIRENTDNVELVSMLDDVEISAKENTSTVNLNSEGEARRLAQLLGIEVDGKKVDKKTDINKVLSAIENVRKIDVRIEGRSTLEPPIWSDLNDRQKMQYWKEGKVEFVGDPERGNQTWTRKQIMFNSRRNNDNIPDDVANLEDNVTARPDINQEDYAGLRDNINQEKARLDAFRQRAEKRLIARQESWDRKYGDDPNNAPNPRPTKENNKEYKGLMRVANGETGMGQAIKQRLINYENQLKEDQKAWDSEYSRTHLNDGSAKKGSSILNDNESTKKKSEIVDNSNKDKKEKINTALENKGVNEFDVSETPIVPVQGNTTSRETFIAQSKIKISNGDMTVGELNKFLDNADKFYPGVSSEIISTEARKNYEQVDLRPASKEEVVKDFKKPEKVVITTRPPEGTVVEKDGQPYIWLGVKDGIGGMWAKLKPDGTKGTTNHPNHNDLMTTWRDGQINQDRPAELQQVEITDNEPNVDKRTTQINKNISVAPETPKGDISGQQSNINVSQNQDDNTQPKEPSTLVDPVDASDEFKRKDKDPVKPGVQTTFPNTPPPGTGTSQAQDNNPNQQEIPADIKTIVNDPDNDKNLLPNTKQVQTTPDAPIKFFPQDKLTKDQKDAIAGRGKYGPGQVSSTDTVDKGADVKDQDPNTAGIQTAQDLEGGVAQGMDQADQAQDNNPNAEVNPTNTTAQDNNPNQATDTAQANQDAADAAMGTAAIVTPAVTKSKLNVTTDKNRNRKNTGKADKTGVMRKGARWFGGDDDASDEITDLMKFYPADYKDPLDLDKYKGAIGRSRGLTGQK